MYRYRVVRPVGYRATPSVSALALVRISVLSTRALADARSPATSESSGRRNTRRPCPAKELSPTSERRGRSAQLACDKEELAKLRGLDADAEGAAVKGLEREEVERMAERNPGACGGGLVVDVTREQSAHARRHRLLVEDGHRLEVAHSVEADRDGARVRVPVQDVP